MRIVVAYDISDDVKRQRLALWLQQKGFTRIQRSVFVGRGGIATAKDIERFARKILGSGDKLHIFLVSDVEWERRIAVGEELEATYSTRIL
ncbi:MAG: CRISPR-associated endonuclease Cas2 [Desulfurococcaceae archaeon]|jgi:CRISPR-associated protein Cas2|nr:CRISPR-associated endonuclease Cas2 [Desulfurococcaceae archaeon]MCC6057868.1 CRISPR-associated endonuclease Cas2 [Desulfurococcaceae archaeon]